MQREGTLCCYRFQLPHLGALAAKICEINRVEIVQNGFSNSKSRRGGNERGCSGEVREMPRDKLRAGNDKGFWGVEESAMK